MLKYQYTDNIHTTIRKRFNSSVQQQFLKYQKLKLSYQDVSDILGYKLGVAITGTEDIETTLIVTEGFGKVSMSDKTYNISKHRQIFFRI